MSTQTTERKFTPRTPEGDRLDLRLSDADWSKIKTRTREWRATVTDTVSGKRYNVHGASCGLPACYCDAIAREVGAA